MQGYDGVMSTVSAEQLEMVRQWAGEGVDLNGIQKRLAAECGVHLTYMDVRFLLLDHGIEIATAAAPEQVKQPEPAAPAASAAEPMPAPEAGQPGKPVVTLDELTLPGTLISGKVAFASGTRGGVKSVNTSCSTQNVNHSPYRLMVKNAVAESSDAAGSLSTPIEAGKIKIGMMGDMVGIQMGMAMGQQMVNQMNMNNQMNGGQMYGQPNMGGQQMAGGSAPKFCPNCGTPTNGAKFCSNCGNKLV